MTNLKMFLEELKKTTGVSIKEIMCQKQTRLVELSTSYCIGYMVEIANMNIEDVAFVLSMGDQMCKEVFDKHDKFYYSDPQYKKTYDIIIGRLTGYGVDDIPIAVVIPMNKPERPPLFSTPTFFYATSTEVEDNSKSKSLPKRKLRS